MSVYDEQRVGALLGYLGAGLFLLGGFFAIFSGAMSFVGGRLTGALDMWTESVLLLVVAGLAGLFTWLGRHDWQARPWSAGIMLLITSLVGLMILGFGGNLLALVGAVMAFLAGALFLIRPVERALGALPAAV